MNIHENISRLREEKDMTLEEVGKRTGTTKQTIKRYESGEISNIPYDRIIALSDCFNVTPGYLMGWEDKENVSRNEANTDVALTNIPNHLKEYALRLASLSKDNQELIMQMIDKLKDKKGE